MLSSNVPTRLRLSEGTQLIVCLLAYQKDVAQQVGTVVGKSGWQEGFLNPRRLLVYRGVTGLRLL